jgi:hypothetical protein
MGVCTAIMLGPTLVVGEIVPGNGSLTSQHPDLAKFHLQKRKLFGGHHMVQAAKRCCENQTWRFSGVYIYIFVFAVDFPEYVITHWNIDDYIIFGFASRKFKENTHIK